MLTTALALIAVPGFAGSRVPSALEPVPAGAFQPYSNPASTASSTQSMARLDRDFQSAGVLDARSRFIEPGTAPQAEASRRVRVDQPESDSASSRKPPKDTLTGEATFYDAGFTAMRLPRGTTVIICGAGGCIERVITDYGPVKPSRIVDLYRPDFFAICGCPSWSGITKVTVYVY